LLGHITQELSDVIQNADLRNTAARIP